MADDDRTIDAQAIEALTAGLIADLDKEVAAIDARVAEANRVLRDCATERVAIESKRNTILQVHAMQIAYLSRHDVSNSQVPPCPVPPPAQEAINAPRRPGPGPMPSFLLTAAENAAKSKPRARIGPQRYFILTDIHENGPTTIEAVSERTGLTLKRVKDQVRSDLVEGILDEVMTYTDQPEGGTPMLRLSNAGGDLLRRFVEYRRATNQALPTREEALGQQEEGVFS